MPMEIVMKIVHEHRISDRLYKLINKNAEDTKKILNRMVDILDNNMSILNRKMDKFLEQNR